MEELLDPTLADTVIAPDPFADMALDANVFALIDEGGGTDSVFAAMLVDDGAMTQNLDDDSGHPEDALSDWLNGFIAERNSHPRIPGDVVEIGDDGRSSGWTDSMFALSDDITVTALAMIDSMVLHDYMDALNYAQQILMLLQSLEAMAMQDLGQLQLAELVVPGIINPPSADEIAQRQLDAMLSGDASAFLAWVAQKDNLAGIPGFRDTNNDGDVDWLDAASLYNVWSEHYYSVGNEYFGEHYANAAAAAQASGTAFNDSQPNDIPQNY